MWWWEEEKMEGRRGEGPVGQRMNRRGEKKAGLVEVV